MRVIAPLGVCSVTSSRLRRVRSLRPAAPFGGMSTSSIKGASKRSPLLLLDGDT